MKDGKGTLLDLNSALRQDGPDHKSGRDRSMDKERVERIREEANSRIKGVLHHLFPQGYVSGSRFFIGDVRGNPGKSLCVELEGEKRGVWKDFANEDQGGDIFDLWMLARGVGFTDTLRQVENLLAMAPITSARERREASNPPIGGKARKESRELPDPPVREKKQDLGVPTKKWLYRDAAGRVIATHTRYDPPGEKKEFRPWDVITKRQAFPNPRPLYNLPGIVKSNVVILVEGEKCADALIDLGYCGSTAMGGSNAPPDKTDWTPLAGKLVLIWPDNDPPGAKGKVPGLIYAENARRAIEAVGGKPKILGIPPGKPEKWDAADAVKEGMDVHAYLKPDLPEVEQKQYRISLLDWTLQAYRGNPPEQEWLVDHVFPMASASVLAAAGGSGKGMLALHLALQVICDHEADLLNPYPKAFGNHVLQHGTVVIFSAEDDRSEIHRRISRIDPAEKRTRFERNLIVVPLPNAGGPAPIVVPGRNGPEVTQFFHEIQEQLAVIRDLKLVLFDPLSSFAMVDISMSRIEGNFVMSVLSSLASDTGAAVIAAHHLNKFKIDKPIATPDQARAMISGSAAVVDGSRVSYCLWPMDADEARRRCRRLNIEYQRDKVFAGAVVKQNCPVDKSIKTFIRGENGLLYVMDEALRNAKITNEDLKEIVVDVVRRGALAGRPFTIWSRKDMCLTGRREELPVELKDVGRNRMIGLLNELIEAGSIQKCAAPGSKISIWLDVPGGPFSEGTGKFEPGFVEI